MVLEKVLSTLNNPKISALGTGNYSTLLGSSSAAMLLRPLQELGDLIRQRVQAYDACVIGLTSVDSAIKSYADAVSNGDIEVSSDTEYEIPREEAVALLSALDQSRELLGGLSRCVTLTSSAGLAYTLMIDASEEKLYCICGDQDKYPVLYPHPDKEDVFLFKPLWLSSGSYVPESEGSLGVGDNITEVSEVNLSSSGDGDSAMDTISSLASGLTGKYQCNDGDTIISRYRAVAEEISGEDMSSATLNECIDVIASDVEVPENPTSFEVVGENFCEIARSIASSNTINECTVDAIDSLSSGTFKNWISNQVSWATDKPKSVKNFIHRLSTSFAQGGFKGAIYCLYGYVKGQASIVNEDGVLVFTDNSKFMPRDYIAGMVSQVFSGLSQVVSLVIAIVQPVVGIVVNLIGSIAWGIIGSIKQDHSDTRASLSVINSEDDTVNITAYSPISLFHGEVSNSSTGGPFGWYIDYFNMTGKCALLEVPGGALFIGPGGFSGADEDRKISAIRWEFHPLGVPLKHSIAIDFWYPIKNTVYHYIKNGKASYFFSVLEPRWIWNQWKDMLSTEGIIDIEMVNDPSTGVLSEDNDKELYGSVCLSTILFIMWFDWTVKPYHYSDVTNLYVGPIDGYDPKTSDAYADRVVWHSVYSYCLRADPVEPHWDALVQFAQRTIDYNEDFENSHAVFSLFHHSNGQTGVDLAYVCYYSNFDVASLGNKFITIPNESLLTGLCFGNPTPLPNTPIFAHSVPKYNASTFWAWLALSGIVTAVVATGAVILAVKWAKLRKMKQFDNTARMNELRDKAQKAKSGVRQEWDPEAGEYVDKHFDTNSAEGREYVRSAYNEYKRAAFHANLMSNIIGGTRYDVGSYYGDAAESGSSSGLAEARNSLHELLYGESDDNTLDAIAGSSSVSDLTSIITLIKGAGL